MCNLILYILPLREKKTKQTNNKKQTYYYNKAEKPSKENK